MRIDQALDQHPVILTEGAILERLARDRSIHLDPDILHAGFVDNDRGRSALTELYRQYLDIGVAADLPMIVFTPTWKASPDRLRDAGVAADNTLNRDGVRFLDSLRSTFGDYAKKILIGGLMGCRNDAYRPEQALSENQAAVYHQNQARELALAGADFLIAQTLPALSEAAGMTTALSQAGAPYLLSFVVRPQGTLLDGTPLGDAIERIDERAPVLPVGYGINCVHPTVFQSAVEAIGPAAAGRILGLQANTSARAPEELEGLGFLDGEDPDRFADRMLALHRRFSLRILGGCCGTDHRHIRAISMRLLHAP